MTSPIDNLRMHLLTSDTLKRLLIVNVALFLVIRIVNAISGLFLVPVFSFTDVSYALAVPAHLSNFLSRPWTILTYMFFHWDIGHIFFNMLWLYWMGRIFQEYLGNKKLLNTYLMGGVAGAIFFMAAYNFFPRFYEVLPGAFALGASASVLAITVAAATLVPNYRISLLFFGPVALKWIALVTIFLDLISVSGSNAGGHIAHLGGALYGFLYIKQLRRGTDLTGWLTRLFDRLSAPGKRKEKVFAGKKKDEDYNVERKTRQERMDDILDKISQSGYGSLTKEEKDFLFRVSKEE
jgi:membrane associated rhomboid family serine protease